MRASGNRTLDGRVNMSVLPATVHNHGDGTSMTEFYSEPAHFDAWKRGVAIAGARWFGDGQTTPENAGSKWDLAPRVADIEASIGVLSSGEAVFLAALVAFYNDRTGGHLLQNAVGVEVFGLADISAALDEPRRRVIADLLVSYPGW